MSSISSSHLSSPSLVSVATTSSASSSTPLKPSSPSSSSTKPKDYSAAFGQLQSQYGWGASPIPAPVRPAAERKEKKERRKEAEAEERESRASSRTPPQASSGGKDYEAAFGSLSSRFGFGGNLPTLKKSSKAKDASRR